MKNLAIITARSGSKGLKDKNIRDLCGKPLMAYTIETALKSECFDTVMVSTDSDVYARIAQKYGAEVPFLRSSETSTDAAGSWEVVDEVLHRYSEHGIKFDTVCLLQPTSPFRLPEDVVNSYKLFVKVEADAVTAVCEAEHAAGVYLTLPNDGSMKDYREEKGYYLPRQMQEKLYRINGAVYIRRILYEEDYVQTVFVREFAYVMPKERSMDIDDEYDFKIAEMELKLLKES